MSTKYNIHPDFDKFPVLTLRFSAIIIWLINLLIKVTRWPGKRKFDLDTEKHTVVSAGGARFEVIVMKPDGLQKPAPALLFYHGGAFALTYASNHLESCERYANEAGCIVVFVDYRLAPKHPFPCAFDDSYAALQWTIQAADTLGIDRDDSAEKGQTLRH